MTVSSANPGTTPTPSPRSGASADGRTGSLPASRCAAATNAGPFDSQTDVCFDALSDEQIDYYLETYRPYDKAGAYGIQEWIGYVAIRRIEGSFYNVMGLPVQKLYGELERFIEA